MKKESDDILFVEVHQPEEVRRNILESIKDIVENLQRFEKFKDIRKEKIDNINKLGKNVKQINGLMTNLKNSLPKTQIRAMKVASKNVGKEKPTRVKTKKSGGESKKPASELDTLQSELSEIESKLSSLK